jgi:hypothetical protein
MHSLDNFTPGCEDCQATEKRRCGTIYFNDQNKCISFETSTIQ